MRRAMRALGLVLAGVVLSAPLGARAQQADDAALQDTLQMCFQCHGENGVSRLPSRPTIAGQRETYLALQLAAFKRAAQAGIGDDDGDGDENEATLKRTDPIMQHMAAILSDDDIPKIAQAVSKLACDGGEARPPLKNPPSIPPIALRCAACHGEDGISLDQNTPNLAGQQRAYLRRQLLLIRETAWGAKPREGEEWRSHPIMESQTARLQIQDVDALARYYSVLDCRGAAPASGVATE